MKKYAGYALVTGGDKGIGYCIAEQLAKNGYPLVLVARDEAALEKAKGQLAGKYKVDVLICVKDLSEANSSQEVYDFVEGKGIHVALLVNNAGFGAFGLLEDSKHELQTKMIDVMCRSLTELTYLFLPSMIKKGEGGIILISSFVSKIHMPNYAVYAACKAFTSSFGITLNYEVQSKNIDVLVVCPAAIKTNFYNSTETKELMKRGQAKLLGFKYHTPEYVAKQAINSLGKKIEIVNGNLMDKFFYYSMAFTPLPIQRMIMRAYLKKVYEKTY